MAFRKLTLHAIQGSIRCLVRDTWVSRREAVRGSILSQRYSRAAYGHRMTVWDVLASMPDAFLYVGYHGYRYVLPRAAWDAMGDEERAAFEARCNRTERSKAPLVRRALASTPETTETRALSMEELLLKQRA